MPADRRRRPGGRGSDRSPRAKAPGKRGAPKADRIGSRAWAVLEIAGSLAENSKRLSTAERKELAALRKKAKGKRDNLSAAEQARYVALVTKAVVPEGFRVNAGSTGEAPADDEVGRPRNVDPVDRLAKLADLRDRGALADDEFDRLKQRLMRDV
jgi:hypothetical protein